MFKKGDKVKRIKESHMGMKTGNTATVKRVAFTNTFFLKEFDGGHDPRNFKLIRKGGKTMALKDKFVLVADSEGSMESNSIFDTKKEAMEWVEENEKDPILCKLVPVCRIKFKAVEEKL